MQVSELLYIYRHIYSSLDGGSPHFLEELYWSQDNSFLGPRLQLGHSLRCKGLHHFTSLIHLNLQAVHILINKYFYIAFQCSDGF